MKCQRLLTLCRLQDSAENCTAMSVGLGHEKGIFKRPWRNCQWYFQIYNQFVAMLAGHLLCVHVVELASLWYRLEQWDISCDLLYSLHYFLRYNFILIATSSFQLRIKWFFELILILNSLNYLKTIRVTTNIILHPEYHDLRCHYNLAFEHSLRLTTMLHQFSCYWYNASNWRFIIR